VRDLLYSRTVSGHDNRAMWLGQQRADTSLRTQMAVLTRGYRRRLSVIVLGSFLSGMAEASILFILARVAFALANEKGEVPASIGPFSGVDLSVGTLLLIAAVLVVVRLGLEAALAWEQTAIYGRVLTGVREGMLHDYLASSWAVQSEDRDGGLQELLGGFAAQSAGQMNGLVSFLGAACTLVALLFTAFLANAVGTLVIAAAAVALIAVMRPLRAALRRRSGRTAFSNVDLATTVNETASMIQEIRVFGVTAAAGDRLSAQVERNRVSMERQQRLSQLVPVLFQSLALLVVVGAVGLVDSVGTTRLASLGAVVLIGVRALSYAQSVQSNYQSLHTAAPFAEVYEAARARYAAASMHRGTRRLDAIDTLAFQDVSYRYDESGRFALDEMSWTASRGEVIGIVGPSGAGKSTLVQLMLRLREPTGGRMTANGVDAAEYDPDDWNRLVTFVPQEAHLFHGTVAENIRFFRDASAERVAEAARRAHLHADVATWPDGYDTAVGEQGRKLSGGQKQRLTIARALVGDPDVIVLDEPTSSLDVKSESVIRETMTELGRDRIVFVVAHRLSTLDACNRIMVVQDGRLRAFDAPTVLEQSSDFYREALELSGLR
jgi:ABC-type multidrug transport system fused ATPase/permease subunit